MKFGIRGEHKAGERRAPLDPSQVAGLIGDTGAGFVVQPSATRVFGDEQYRQAGAELSEDLAAADVILAIKEVPPEQLLPGKVYVFFAHVIKGQPHNMAMLQTLLDRGCTLIDYEKITDARGRRLIFFGNYAGLAGIYEALYALGRRLRYLGIETPFLDLRRPVDCPDLAACAAGLQRVGERIADEGLPRELVPLVIGFAGYGNVSQGAQSVIDQNLPVRELPVERLATLGQRPDRSPRHVYKTVFEERHMAEPVDGGQFVLQDYYDHPHRYRGIFARHLPHLDLLVNCIFWTESYPRLVTLDWCRRQFADGAAPRLKLIADISCDVRGSIECTVQTTSLAAPVFTYDPLTDGRRLGVEGRGLTVLAVDNLPAALPREASTYFGAALGPFLPGLAAAVWEGELEDSGLPAELRRAVIVWRGRLTGAFGYLKDHLPAGAGR